MFLSKLLRDDNVKYSTWNFNSAKATHNVNGTRTVGLDTNISKNALNYFLEILIKIPKFLRPKFALNFSEISFFPMFFSTIFASCKENMVKLRLHV